MAEVNTIPVYQIYSSNSDVQSPNYMYMASGTNNIDPSNSNNYMYMTPGTYNMDASNSSNYYQIIDNYSQNMSTQMSGGRDTYINLDNQNIVYDQNIVHDQSACTAPQKAIIVGFICIVLISVSFVSGTALYKYH